MCIAVLLLTACGFTTDPTAIPPTTTPIFVVVTVTPSPTPMLAYTPVTNPTPHRLVPTIANTPVYKSVGLGISRYELKSLVEQLGYRFRSEQTDRVVGLRGSAAVALVNPVADLSKVHILFSPGDIEAVIDLTAIAIAIDPSLGDLEWIFDALIAGQRSVSKNYGRIRVVGEVSGTHTIAITFESL